MRDKLPILLLCLGLAISVYIVDSDILKTVLLFVTIIISLVSNNVNEVFVFWGLALVLPSFSSPLYWMLACLPLFVNSHLFHAISRYSNYLIIFFVLALLSFFLGQKSEISTMLVLFMSVLLFVQVLGSKLEPRDLWLYSLFSLLVLLLVLAYESTQGGVDIKFGRLSLNGSIRTVANIAAFPSLISWSLLFQRDNTVNKPLLILVGLVSSIVLLLTISKGAILAVIAGVLLSGSYSIKVRNIVPLLLVSVALYFVFNRFLLSSEEYHFYRLFEEVDGLSGRTDIWDVFLTKFLDSPSTILFGFGPGDIKRFSFADETYAHSFFLDLLLSYGVIMCLLYFLVLSRIAIKIYKTRSPLSTGVLVFTLLLFATHGVVTLSSFYICIGASYATCCGSTIKKSVQ